MIRVSILFPILAVSCYCHYYDNDSDYSYTNRTGPPCLYPYIHLSLSIDWKLLNITLSCGVLRLIQCRDLEDISAAIEKVYHEMCPPDAIDMMKAQARYFDSRLGQLTSARAAKAIYHRSLNKLAVPLKDISLLQNGFNSHSNLITAQIQGMKEECPASVDSIYKVYYFFTSKKEKMEKKEKGEPDA